MPRGRPKKEIDQKKFEELCTLPLKQQQICNILSVDHKTLSGWCRRTYGKPYLEVFCEKQDVGVEDIVKAQKDLALKGNATMLIWLGKVQCGQSEKPSVDVAESELSEKSETQFTESGEDAIRQELLDQLKAAGRDTAVNRDLVEDYVLLWASKQRTRLNLRTQGPVITYNNGGGQNGTKENPALDQQLKLGKQMENIMKQLGLSCENAVGGDDFDGL